MKRNDGLPFFMFYITYIVGCDDSAHPTVKCVDKCNSQAPCMITRQKSCGEQPLCVAVRYLGTANISRNNRKSNPTAVLLFEVAEKQGRLRNPSKNEMAELHNLGNIYKAYNIFAF